MKCFWKKQLLAQSTHSLKWIITTIDILKNITHYTVIYIFRLVFGSSKEKPKKTSRKKSSRRGSWENPCRPKALMASGRYINRDGRRRKKKNKSMSSSLLFPPSCLSSTFLSSPSFLSTSILFLSSPPSSFTCMSSTPTLCSTVWVVGFFFLPLSLSLARCVLRIRDRISV